MFAMMRRFPWLRRAGVVSFTLPLMFAGGSLVGELDAVGGVGPLEISRNEFANQYRQIEEQYRRQYEFEETPPDLARYIADQARTQLVSDYLIRAAVRDKQIEPSNAAITEEIRQMEDFQDNGGNFSISLFNSYVRDERELTQRVREGLRRKPILLALQATPAEPVREKLSAYRRQQRVARQAVVTVTTVFDISEEDVAAYYAENRSDYQIPEESDWEYVVVSVGAHLDKTEPTEEDLAAAEEELVEEKAADVQREVRHIYIDGEDDAAKARVDEIIAQARANPDSFADLAREFSDDAGSAENGGSLGAVVAGDLPQAMEDALLTLSAGDISDAVLVDGGFSILRASFSETLETVSAEDIAERARFLLAQDSFLDSLERLQEVAHLNVGSLNEVALTAGAVVQTVVNISREELAEGAPEFFAVPEIREQLFVSEILEIGETTEPIALNDNEYLIARVSRYVPTGEQAPSEVEDEIKGILAAREEIKIMQQAESPPTNLVWGPPLTLSLLEDEDEEPPIEAALIHQIFFADLTKGLPALAYAPDVQQVQIFRIEEVIDTPPNEEDKEHMSRLMTAQAESAYESAYLESLAERYEIYFNDI